MWKDLIKPTIFGYIIVCAILAEIVGVYYLYSNYPIMVDIFASMQPRYAVQTATYHGSAKNVGMETFDKLYNYIGVETRELLDHIIDAVD
ncbi:hypothetical protein [Desulfosporosinus sp. Sb-LF]|uniref:hypothetical protein n=1 Tax=Desulfosporosinus sp. Sb-LF TaxID=2560027 RepID=UPI0018EE8AC6|nr:hypothetical protein [Desulfosporosinus sp. Sb-LF]